MDGKEYHLPRHGFARDAVFTLISQSERKVTFALESSEKTKEVYPYDFTLSVSYVLDGNTIGVIWHVHNTDTREIHFQIGGHPAFNVPDMKPGVDQQGRIRLDNTDPMDALHSYPDSSHEMDEASFIEAEDGMIEFTDNTWRNDSIKVHKCQLHRAELLNKAGEPEVTVEFRTPVVAFWSPYGKQAICVHRALVRHWRPSRLRWRVQGQASDESSAARSIVHVEVHDHYRIILQVSVEFLQGRECLACVIVEETAVEPALDDAVAEGILLSKPPEEADNVVVALEFCDKF